jgi:hypothetical protein
VKGGAGHRGTEALITSERFVCRLHETPPFPERRELLCESNMPAARYSSDFVMRFCGDVASVAPFQNLTDVSFPVQDSNDLSRLGIRPVNDGVIRIASQRPEAERPGRKAGPGMTLGGDSATNAQASYIACSTRSAAISLSVAIYDQMEKISALARGVRTYPLTDA